jgi:hypothetical protein
MKRDFNQVLLRLTIVVSLGAGLSAMWVLPPSLNFSFEHFFAGLPQPNFGFSPDRFLDDKPSWTGTEIAAILWLKFAAGLFLVWSVYAIVLFLAVKERDLPANRTKGKYLVIGLIAFAMAPGAFLLWKHSSATETVYSVTDVHEERPTSLSITGTTMLKSPEKIPPEGWSLIGEPIKIEIIPALTSNRVLSLRFAGVKDYVILFPAEYTSSLVRVLDDWERLKAKLADQPKNDYSQKLGALAFLDPQGERKEIELEFRVRPSKQLERNGFKQDVGRVYALYLRLPFVLEERRNAGHTELRLAEGAVVHLRHLLRELLRSDVHRRTI